MASPGSECVFALMCWVAIPWSLSAPQRPRVAVVRDHQLDGRREVASFVGIDEGLEVATSTRRQNADSKLLFGPVHWEHAKPWPARIQGALSSFEWRNMRRTLNTVSFLGDEPILRPMTRPSDPQEIFRSTTVLCVLRDGRAALGADGQVSLGNTIMKGTATKVRSLAKGKGAGRIRGIGRRRDHAL